MNGSQYRNLALTLCISVFACDDSTVVSLLDDDQKNIQSDVIDINLDSLTKIGEWRSDKVWQNMLAVAIQVPCAPYSSHSK